MIIRNVLVINGPNLDMLGTREPDIYGLETLARLEQTVQNYGRGIGFDVSCYQSNSEAKLIDKIHRAPSKYDAIVYNPAAHTHYSYALRDAVASVDIPVVEVHLSDIDGREPFRQTSVIAPACVAQIKGLGTDSYLRALDLLREGTDFQRLGEGFEAKVEGNPAIVVATDSPQTLVAPTVAAAEESPVVGSTLTATEVAEDVVTPTLVAPAQEEPSISLTDAAVAAAVPEETEAGPLAEPSVAEEPKEPKDQKPQDFAAPYGDELGKLDEARKSAERQNLVRAACARLGVGALLLRDTANIHWLCDVDGVFDEERAHSMLIAANMACVHTDSRYSDALAKAIKASGGNVIVDNSSQNASAFAWDILTQKGAANFGAMLGIEDTITYAEFVALVERFTAEGLAPTSEVVLRLRSVKDPGEILRLKAAQAVTDAAFAYITTYMKPGMTERDVAIELENYMLRHGASDLAFRSIVATGENGANPHAIPSHKKLEAGQCVVMDFGAKAFDYCSDMTRTVFLGQPDDTLASAWRALREANEAAEALLKPGVTGKQAQETVEGILDAAGYGGKMGHGLGHGVGLEIHELPTLNLKNEEPLIEGNVVTVEPGIYMPGSFGMRLEDFGVVTADGFEVFTQSTHEMVII